MASPIIIYVIMELLSGKSVNRDERINTYYLIVFGLVMTLMIGLRNPQNGSGDTMFYYMFWERLSQVPFSELRNFIASVDLEVGYQFVTWLLSQIFHNGQWLLFLSGAFFAVSVCLFVKRNCENVVLALTVFNCLGLFNFIVQGLRQAIAMCICLWAVEQCKKRNLVKFLLLIVIASLFHASAVVFVIVYVVAGLELDIKSYSIVTLGTIAVILLLPRLFEVVNYFINDNYTLGKGSEEGGQVAILIYISILAFGMFFKDRKNPHYALFIYMTVIGVSCMILRNSVSEIIERISHFFAFAEMVVISNSIKSLEYTRVQLLINIAVAALCLAVAAYKASYSILIPYLFLWQA